VHYFLIQPCSKRKKKNIEIPPHYPNAIHIVLKAPVQGTMSVITNNHLLNNNKKNEHNKRSKYIFFSQQLSEQQFEQTHTT